MVRFLLSALAALSVASAAATCPGCLTPKSGPAPKINGPAVYGARPGHPFLYRIPATGERPMRFSAKHLPGGLRLDPRTGIIDGTTPRERGTYVVTLAATNARGKTRRTFKIVAGDTLALTPTMGWNHWYTHYHHVSDKIVRQAADAMISSGMADAGYQYVNIDDCWAVTPGSKDPETGGPARDAGGAVLPNKRFPDMRALTAYIHAKGLKAGIYSSPGDITCTKCTGARNHEEIDARKFAEWGFDFLKYDWCYYAPILRDRGIGYHRDPYVPMGRILKTLGRDFVYNICQDGTGEPWKWGREIGGHSWRTTGDLGLTRDTRLPAFYSVGFRTAELSEYAGPGHWNDPDYLLIGYVGNARRREDPPKLTTLTPDEQYSYMSMWCLMASPLVYSGEMSMLDEFTLNVLTNAEVIEVDQDALGRQARIVRKTGDEFILAKPMEDGSLALGLFNLSEKPRHVSVTWKELGIQGQRRVRDLWRQKNLGLAGERYTAEVNRHGVALVRLSNQ
jgi:alpha-galactosidase